MSKENALVELWHILNGKRKDDISLFEWKHRHVRAVWRAGKDGDGNELASPPKNIIFGYYEKGTEGKKSLVVAYALVDVIGRSLRVRPLAVSVPNQVWTFNKIKMAKLDNGSIALRKQNIELPTADWSKAGPNKSNIRFVYQRGETEYTDFVLKDILRVWGTKTWKISSFFTKKNHKNLTRAKVSVYAENLSMGIELKGLGFIRNPGPSTILKTPVASAKIFTLKKPNFHGIHYAGLGIGDFNTSEGWSAPLGMMFLDTLFLDSFTLTPHDLKKGTAWPPKGYLVEFFQHPNLGVKSYTHRDATPDDKDRTEVTASSFTSYLLKKDKGFIMKIGNKQYTPMLNISFLFDKDLDGLQQALNGEYLMRVLVGNFKKFETFKKKMSQMFSEDLLKDVALRFFGNKDFFKIETKEEDEESKETQEKKVELALALEAAKLIIKRIKKIQKKFNDFGNRPDFSKNAVTRTEEFEKGLKLLLTQIAPIKTEINKQKKTLTDLHTGTLLSADIFGDIDNAKEDLDEAWTTLRNAIRNQIRAFLTKDYAGLVLFKNNMTISIGNTNVSQFNKNYTSDGDVLVAAEKLRTTAMGYLTNKDTKEWSDEKAELIALNDKMEKAKAILAYKTNRGEFNAFVDLQVAGFETFSKVNEIADVEKKIEKILENLRKRKLVLLDSWTAANKLGANNKELGTSVINTYEAAEKRLQAIVTKKKKEKKKDPVFVEVDFTNMTKTVNDAKNAFTTAAEAAQLLLNLENRTPALTTAMKTLMVSINKFGTNYTNLKKTKGTQKNVVVAREEMTAAVPALLKELQNQVTIFLDQDIARMTQQEIDMKTSVTTSHNDNKVQNMKIFNETAGKIQKGIKAMSDLIASAGNYYKKVYKPQQETLRVELTEIQKYSLLELRTDEQDYIASIKAPLKGTTKETIEDWKNSLTRVKKEIKELEFLMGAKPPIVVVIPKLGKPPREILYGSAKPAAAVLYHLGNPGRIDVTRMQEDPAYSSLSGPEISNLSNFSLEFYGSSGAALASQLSLGASIQAENLVPKAVTVDAGRLEQTAFDYYYGAYWVDEYTGFETAGNDSGGGKVTSSPGNYITLPDRGGLLYHIGANKVGSMAYDFGTMAQEVSFDNPDFEVMLRAPVLEDIEAPPGSSRLSTSGAIILGLRLPEGGSGFYSLRFIAYAPKIVKM